MFKWCFLFTVLFLMGSCVGSKRLVESSNVKEVSSKIEFKKDSSSFVERNKEIKDNISLSLRTNNKKVDSIIRQRLKGFNSSKKSGTNRYNAVFDYEKMALNIAAVIGATQNEVTEYSSELEKETSVDEKVDSYVKTKISVVPWYVWVLLYFFFLDSKVVSIVSNFIPGLKGATSILSILNLKKDE